MELEKKISEFFFLSKKMFTEKQLKRIFSINDDEEEKFLKALDTLVDKKIINKRNGRYYSDYEKDELATKIEEFFLVHKKIYSLNDLEKIFKINNLNRVKFYNCLNELEMQGKIFCLDEKSFVHVPEDSYLKSGSLMESKQGKYYIKTEGETITIEDIKSAKVDDIVFVIEDLDKKKHPKHGFGKIVRIVKPISSTKQKDYMTNGIINRDIKNDSYWFLKDFVKIPIKKKDLNGAYPLDKANVLVSYDKNNKPFAKVINIIERKNNKHIFTYHNGIWESLGLEKIKATLNDGLAYKENDQILASLSLEKVNGYYTLELIEKVDFNTEKPRDKMRLFAIDRGLSFEFNEKVLEEAENIKKEITPEEIEKRLDLRELETFTIDSSFAKDLDDAVSIEKLKNGYRLYVHIADVSYYVRPGSLLFNEAIKRGTSVYFGDMVIPELPEVISNGVCSLNPNEEKLTKTLIMDFDEEANLLNFSLHNSVIKSNMKMAYNKVNDLLEGTNIDGEYLPFYESLFYMQILASKLEEQRIKRGSTSFTSLEYIYELDENGKPISISERKDGPAQKIIEHFMIITNQTLAEYAYWLELPYVFRNHECPQLEKINILNTKIKQLSSKFKQIKNLDNPRVLQRYYENICKNKTTQELKYLSNIFLQSLPRAYYDNENKGHYGLALDYYATFTSPIRRGPDLLNHLFLGEVLEEGIQTKLMEELRDKLKEYADELSLRQREADNFELEIDFLLLKTFADDYYDQELDANIEFIMEDKMYVKTTNNLVGVIELDKNYVLDKDKNILIDTLRNIKYTVGDLLKVNISTYEAKKHYIIFNISKSEKAKKLEKSKK